VDDYGTTNSDKGKREGNQKKNSVADQGRDERAARGGIHVR
jgi:hypothetical protein